MEPLAARHLLEGQRALVSSQLLLPGEIRRAYLWQMFWVAMTIVLGILLRPLYEKLPLEQYSNLQKEQQGLHITIIISIAAEIGIVFSYFYVTQQRPLMLPSCVINLNRFHPD